MSIEQVVFLLLMPDETQYLIDLLIVGPANC